MCSTSWTCADTYRVLGGIWTFQRFLAASLDLMSLQVFILLLLCLSICLFILNHNHVAIETFYSVSVSLVIWTKSEWIEMLNSVRNTETHPNGDWFYLSIFVIILKNVYVWLVNIKHWLPELSPFIYILWDRSENAISSPAAA